MSQEFLEHLFEPFVQEKVDARSVYHGIGLGMAIVKGLVEKMNVRLAKIFNWSWLMESEPNDLLGQTFLNCKKLPADYDSDIIANG